MELISLYKSIHKFAGLSSDEKGFVSTTDKKEPVFINKDRLVLPVPYQMRENTDPERIIFHPLADNILQGESKVVTKLKHNINVRLNQAIALLGQYLLTIASDTSIHPTLNPEQLRYITAIKEVDEKVAGNWGNFAAALMKDAPDRAYVNIFLCRGGSIKNVKYSRVGVASFPLYDKLRDPQSDDYKSLKVREMDKVPFRQTLEVILDAINVEQSYDVGSHSNYAPYLQALMLTAAGIASALNNMLRVFRNAIPDDDATVFIAKFTSEMEWLHDMTNMDELGPEIRKVPPQKDGSVGAISAPVVVDNAPVPNAVAPVAHAQPAPQVMTAPVAAAAAPAKGAGGLSIKSFLTGNQQLQPHQQQMMAAAAVPGMVPGQVMMQQVMGPNGQMVLVPVQMPAAAVGMAPGMVPGAPMNVWQMQQMQAQQLQQQQQQMPTWAMPDPNQFMVNTPRGIMSQAVAQQLGLQWQPLPAQAQQRQNGMPGWA